MPALSIRLSQSNSVKGGGCVCLRSLLQIKDELWEPYVCTYLLEVTWSFAVIKGLFLGGGGGGGALTG